MKDKIKLECMKNPREESCGFLLFEKRRTKIVPCNKVGNFKISPRDFVKTRKRGEIFGVYHSHVNGDSAFSKKDIVHSEEIMLPYFLYSIESNSHNVFVPEKLTNKTKSFKNFLSRVKKIYSVK